MPKTSKELSPNKEKESLKRRVIAALASTAIAMGFFFWGIGDASAKENKEKPKPTNQPQNELSLPDAFLHTGNTIDKLSKKFDREQFEALKDKYGNIMSTKSIKQPTSDDKTDFLLRGEGDAINDIEDFEREIFTNPFFLRIWTAPLVEYPTSSGETIGELHPSFYDFIKKYDDSNGKHFHQLDGSKEHGKQVVTAEYQEYAYDFLKAIREFSLYPDTENDDMESKDNIKAHKHWTRKNGETPHDGWLPKGVIEINEPYIGDFFILGQLTEKGNDHPNGYILAINKSDGRPALIKLPFARIADGVLTMVHPNGETTKDKIVTPKPGDTPKSDRPKDYPHEPGSSKGTVSDKQREETVPKRTIDHQSTQFRKSGSGTTPSSNTTYPNGPNIPPVENPRIPTGDGGEQSVDNTKTNVGDPDYEDPYSN